MNEILVKYYVEINEALERFTVFYSPILFAIPIQLFI